MSDFLKRFAGIMTREELERYTGLEDIDHVLRIQLLLLRATYEDDVYIAATEKSEDTLEEADEVAIAERLEKVADSLDALEEKLLIAAKTASYDELPDIFEELFDAFHEKEKLRGN